MFVLLGNYTCKYSQSEVIYLIKPMARNFCEIDQTNILINNKPTLILNFNKDLSSNIFRKNAVFYEFLELRFSSLGN